MPVAAKKFALTTLTWNPDSEKLERVPREVYASQYDYPSRVNPTKAQMDYLKDSFGDIWDGGFVYVIKHCNVNMTKIGYSKDPDRRLLEHIRYHKVKMYVRAILVPPPYKKFRLAPAGEALALKAFNGRPINHEHITGLMPNDVIEWAIENDFFVVSATYKEKI